MEHIHSKAEDKGGSERPIFHPKCLSLNGKTAFQALFSRL